MCYTSGTTGRPKGAVLTHGDLVASTLSWIHEMGAGPGRRLALRPCRSSTSAASTACCRSSTLGATSVVTPTTGFDPDAALERIERHGVTMCIFVPTQWEQICGPPRVRDARPRAGCASPCGARRRRRARRSSCLGETFPDGRDRQRATGRPRCPGRRRCSRARTRSRKMGSVGKPMIGVELRVVDDDLRDVAAGRGRRGRLPRPDRHGRVPRQPGSDRRGVRRRLVPQRRPRAARRRGLPVARRPQEGPDHQRRRERLPRRGRARPARASRRRRRRGRSACRTRAGCETPLAVVVPVTGRARSTRTDADRPLPRAPRGLQEAVRRRRSSTSCRATRPARCSSAAARVAPASR